MADLRNTDCIDHYWTGAEDSKTYNSSWNIPSTSSVQPPDQWTHQTAWQLRTFPYVGTLASYTGSGYITELPPERESVDIVIQDLRTHDWIDRNTAALFVEFTIYNPNVKLYSVVVILFEFSNNGAIHSSYQIFTSKLFHYSGDFGVFLLVCEVCFILFVLIFTYQEGRKFLEQKENYFLDSWSYAELCMIVLSYSAIAVYFVHFISINSTLTEYRNREHAFVNFSVPVFWDYTLGYIQAFLELIVIVKIFKMFHFNPRTNMLTNTLRIARAPLVGCMLLIFICFVAFGHSGMLLFGTSMMDFSTFLSTLMTLFNLSLGVSDYYGMEEANRALGPLYFFLFCVVLVYILLVIFISVLITALREARATYKTTKGDVPVTWYLYNHLVKIIGFNKERDLSGM